MKSSKNKIFTIAINTIYVLSVLYFIVSLLIQYNNGFSYTEQKFSELTRATTQNLRANPIGSHDFSDVFLTSLEPVMDIESIQLSCDDKLIATYPVKSVKNKGSSLIKSYNTTLTAPNGKKVLLKANLYILKPSAIYDAARVTFLIVLICTMACAFYIFATRNSIDEERMAGEKDGFVSFNDAEDEEITVNDVIIPQDEVTEENITEPIESEAATVQFADKTTEAPFEDKAEQVPETNEEEVIPLPSDDIIKGETAAVEGKTGFATQESLLPHLDNELVRASSASQDLSLVELKIEDVGYEDSVTPAVISLIKETARYNDQVFEYAETNYIMILIDTDIDKAMLLAQNLYKKLYSIINANGKKHNIFIGLSSKSIRLITGSRILNETDQALIRATQDKTNPIVAFKVNPSKYKDYISTEEKE